MPKVMRQFAQLVIDVTLGTHGAFGRFMRDEHQRRASVIREAGIPPQ